MSNKVYVTVGVDKRSIPAGGKAEQFLVKASDEDYDFVWSDVSGTSAERQPSTGVSPKDAYNNTKLGIRGTSVNYARQDHSHPWNVPSVGLPSADGTAAIGDSEYYAAFNHVHPLNVDNSLPEDLGTANKGSAVTYARRDHVHQMPTAADVPSTVGNVQTDLTALYARVQTEISGGISLPTSSWTIDSTITTTTSTQNFNVTVIKSSFQNKVATSGTYIFTYNSNAWKLGGTTIDPAEYGLVITGTLVNNDTITVDYKINSYYQTITIADGTADTVIDLYPDYVVLNQMVVDGTMAIYVETTVENSVPVFTAKAITGKPSVNLTVAARRSELY